MIFELQEPCCKEMKTDLPKIALDLIVRKKIFLSKTLQELQIEIRDRDSNLFATPKLYGVAV